jgi:DNA-binding CsgD family transcriptional regulator
MSSRKDLDPLARALRLLNDQPVPRALERLPLPVWIADSYGHVRWMNSSARRLFGGRLGAHFAVFVGPEGVACAKELFARKVNGRLDSTEQRVLLKTTTGPVEGEMISVPIRDADQVVGVFTLVRVDEQRRPAAAARRRPKPRLTPRQHQVLDLLAKGYSTAQIAETLRIAPDTARNHIRLLLSELRVRTRLEAVVVAFRNDWL